MTFRFGRYELDTDRHRLTKMGRLLRIQPQPLTVLIVLIERAGETVTRRELQAALWPEGTHVEYEPALNTAVRKLRRALGDDAANPQYVQTVPGVGYRFIGAIDSHDAGSVESHPVARTEPASPSPVTRPHRPIAAFACMCALAAAVVPTANGRVSPALEPLRLGLKAMTTAPDAVSVAHAHFETAVTRDPRSAPAWGWFAFTSARIAFSDESEAERRYAFARAAAEKALSLDGRLWTAHAALGYVLAGDARDLVAAQPFFDTAIARGAHDARLFIDYGCLLKDTGQFARALAIIEKGLQRAPASAALRAHRGLHLHAVGRFDEELPALLDAVALDPLAAEAHFHLGLGYARRRQYTAALASLKTSVALSDGAPRFLSWLGRIAADAGNRDDAEEALRTLRRRATVTRVPTPLIDAVVYHLAAARS